MKLFEGKDIVHNTGCKCKVVRCENLCNVQLKDEYGGVWSECLNPDCIGDCDCKLHEYKEIEK